MDKFNNLFQQTPQKDEKNPNGWPTLPNNSIVPVGSQNVPFGITQPPNMPFGSSSNVFPEKAPFTNTFGSTTNSNVFGSSANNSNVFGSSANNNNSFISSNNSFIPPTNNAFGSTPFQSNSSSIGFGSASASPFNNNTTFGTSNVTPGSTTFGVNSITPNQTSNIGSAWGAQQSVSGWNSSGKGSKVAPYASTRIKEDTGIFSELIDITGMREYSTKSVDEIRKEDYEMSFCPPKQSSSNIVTSSGIGLPPSTSSSIFGSVQPTTQSPFQNTSPFGQSGSISNQTSTGIQSGGFMGSTGATSNAFGSSQPNIFGSSILQKPATSFGSTGFGSTTFGSTAQPNPSTSNAFSSNSMQTSSIFGAKPASDSTLVAPSPFSSTLNTQTKPATSLFGSTSTTQPTSNLLLGQQPTSSNLFGQPSTTSSNLFGQPSTTSSNLFGQSSTGGSLGQQQTSSNLFGQPSTTSSNLFGQSSTTSSNLFGQPSTTSSNLFGQSSTGGLLGQQPTSSSLFGQQPTSSNLFGQQPTSNLFGQSSNASAQPTTTNLFNQTSNSNLFGQQPQGLMNNNLFGQPNSSSFMSIQQSAIPLNKVDQTDPFMIKNVHFEKFEQQKPSIRADLPTPIFRTNKDTTMIDLKIRPPRPIQKNSVYTIPDLKDLDTTKSISNLVVGFEGKGRIEFLEPVSVSSIEDLEKRISFRNENVEISDPIGMGLNKKARVYIEGLYPICRTTNEVIKGKVDVFPQKGIQERFIYQLKNDSNKKYVDYNVETGIYVYEVNHF